jgi:hypothetical protein
MQTDIRQWCKRRTAPACARAGASNDLPMREYHLQVAGAPDEHNTLTLVIDIQAALQAV